jgi:hypothetical protein
MGLKFVLRSRQRRGVFMALTVHRKERPREIAKAEVADVQSLWMICTTFTSPENAWFSLLLTKSAGKETL